MKLDKPNLPPLESDKKSKPKNPLPKYEGSRFSSLVLLIVTVLISLAFYASGQ